MTMGKRERRGDGPTYAKSDGVGDVEREGRTEPVGDRGNGHGTMEDGMEGGTALGSELWVMGPYGVIHRDKGPTTIPTRVVEAMIRQCRPAVVVGRYTARYLEQGMVTGGAYVPTNGRDGVAQAAESVMQATTGR